MTPETKFADIDEARQIVQQRYPDARRIEFIEHGYDNVVALVDTNYAVRFPRHHEAYVRSQYEKAILPQLAAITAVAVPHLLESHDTPAYLVTTYVPGRHLAAEAVQALSDTELIKLGETIAVFAYQLHSSLSVTDEQHFRAEAQLGEQFDESWADYFKHMVANGTFASARQAQIARQQYVAWKESESLTARRVVIHDDLHLDNMLFSATELIGIVDFGEANIGTPEQEFRQLCRLDPQVLEAAIKMYQQLSGYQLNAEAIRAWATMQELGAYSRRFQAQQTDHPSFLRSCRYLDTWLPEGNWSQAATRS